MVKQSKLVSVSRIGLSISNSYSGDKHTIFQRTQATLPMFIGMLYQPSYSRLISLCFKGTANLKRNPKFPNINCRKEEKPFHHEMALIFMD
jgi:hypothetical protein